MDCELLAKYQRDRDPRCFERLVEMYRPLVRATLRRVLHDPADLEDAAQETFFRLATHADLIHGSVAGWLAQTARSIAVDAVRRSISERRRVEVLRGGAGDRSAMGPLSTTTPGHPLVQERLRGLLNAALSELDEPARALLVERFFQRRPLRSIARDHGVDLSTVSRRVTRALRELADVLETMGGPTPQQTFELLNDPVLTVPLNHEPMRYASDWLSISGGLAERARVASLAPGWSRPIRVGVFVGYHTCRVVTSNGYSMPVEQQARMTQLMVNPVYELVSIVEPETSHLGPVERTIRQHEITAGLIEGTDLEALRTLDVILFGMNFGVVPGVLETILQAVDAGVGLLNEWWIAYSNTTLIRESAQTRSVLARPPVHQHHTDEIHGRMMPATVRRAHPAIAPLTPGQTIWCNGCGPAYVPIEDAEILVQKECRVGPEHHGQAGVGELPMPGITVGRIGKGRVLVSNFGNQGCLRNEALLMQQFLDSALCWLAEPRRTPG